MVGAVMTPERIAELREIPLSQGKVAIVDASDYADLSMHKWYFARGYAIRNGSTSEGPNKRHWVRMHRVVVGAQDDEVVDHINGDKLDNRRVNLRRCSQAENARNVKKRPSNTSGYKGVVFFNHKQRWRAVIRINDRAVCLGFFDNAEDAAKAYDVGAVLYHGAFANLNFENPLLTEVERLRAENEERSLSYTRQGGRLITAQLERDAALAENERLAVFVRGYGDACQKLGFAESVRDAAMAETERLRGEGNQIFLEYQDAAVERDAALARVMDLEAAIVKAGQKMVDEAIENEPNNGEGGVIPDRWSKSVGGILVTCEIEGTTIVRAALASNGGAE